MGSKKASHTLDDRVANLEKQVEKLARLVAEGISAHRDKINELEVGQIAELRKALRLLTARVDRIEKTLKDRSSRTV